jgi:Uma2 family endonuclease
VAVEALPAAAPATEFVDPPQGGWTYEAFLQLPDDGNRYEVLDGVLYVAPPPSPQHQGRLFNLIHRLRLDIDRRGLGRLFISPIALLMPGATPVQPDAFFVSTTNPVEIDWRRDVTGIPDLVIEVASPSTAGYDRRQKQDAYARAAVPEYWIVEPWALTVEILILDRATGTYRSAGIFDDGNVLPTIALAGLQYTVQELLSD